MTRMAKGWLIALLIYALPSSAAYAGRPLATDDAATVATGHLEIELGFLHSIPDGGGRHQHWPSAGIAYGLVTDLELSMAIQHVKQTGRQVNRINGFEDLRLGAKYKLFDETALLPAFAAAFDIKIPTASRAKGLSSGKTDQSLLAMVSKSLNPVTLHANVGYRFVGKPSDGTVKNILYGGAALEWAMAGRWTMVGEIVGASRSESGGSNSADYQIGLRFAALPQLTLDLAAGRSLRAVGNSFQGAFGATWTIDFAKSLQR